MSIGSRTRRGFTLVEALASITILVIGIVSVMQGLSVMTRARARMNETEVMTRLAHEKLEEILATSTSITSNDSGDFTDRNDQKFAWSVTASQSSQSTSLYNIALTVTKNSDQNKKIVVNSLVYVPATNTTGGAN